MKQVYYCHKYFEPGAICGMMLKNGKCGARGFHDCEHRGITPRFMSSVPPPPMKSVKLKNKPKGVKTMKDKFTMELVWHNCATCPPKEDFNANLCVTNGRTVFGTKYDKGEWYDREFGVCIPDDMLVDFWWADVVQTLNAVADFRTGDQQ